MLIVRETFMRLFYICANEDTRIFNILLYITVHIESCAQYHHHHHLLAGAALITESNVDVGRRHFQFFSFGGC